LKKSSPDIKTLQPDLNSIKVSFEEK